MPKKRKMEDKDGDDSGSDKDDRSEDDDEELVEGTDGDEEDEEDEEEEEEEGEVAVGDGEGDADVTTIAPKVEEDDKPILDDDIKRAIKTKIRPKQYPSLYGNILTKYEETALLGFRKEQIARGAPVYVPVYPTDTLNDIAERELRENKLPYYIQRQMPDGNVISVKLDQLMHIF